MSSLGQAARGSGGDGGGQGQERVPPTPLARVSGPTGTNVYNSGDSAGNSLWSRGDSHVTVLMAFDGPSEKSNYTSIYPAFTKRIFSLHLNVHCVGGVSVVVAVGELNCRQW